MHNIQLVKIQPEERLAASSELNPASCLVTGCGEARGMGYWAATQVKGLSPEIFIVPEADVVVLTEGSTLIADSPIGTWQGDASPAGSETVARYQTDIMGTREAQSVLLTGVCAIKPINGKTVQTTLWESDQFIVPEKQGNACRGKGLAGARWPGRDTPSILRDGQGVSTKLWSITLRERRGCTPEEPDEGKLQVRFCEGAHSNLGAITSKKRCAMGSTRQISEKDNILSPSVKTLMNQRAKVIKTARNKLSVLRRILEKNKNKLKQCIVYCEDSEQLDAVQRVFEELKIDSYIKYHSGVLKRDEALILFKRSNCRFILSMHCLDQGVNIPSCESLILLSSSGNPREYIQRRGRVLRNPVDSVKPVVKIYDILAFTRYLEEMYRGIIMTQLLRAWEFIPMASI